MSGPRLLGCQQERGCEDSEMTSANRMERKLKWHHQKRKLKKREISGRKKTSRQTASNREICQDSKMTSASQIKRQWHHQADKDVESKKCQGQRLPRDHAVDGRASQAVRRCSSRLPLVFIIGSSLSRNFRHPACPGSTWRGFLYIFLETNPTTYP